MRVAASCVNPTAGGGDFKQDDNDEVPEPDMQNWVGLLDTFHKRHLGRCPNPPDFEVTGVTGGDHDRSHTMRGKIEVDGEMLVAEATVGTKKLAKRECAKRLCNLIGRSRLFTPADKSKKRKNLGSQLKRTKSTVPVSTQSRESCIVDARIDTVWNTVSDLKFQWTGAIKGITKDDTPAMEVGGLRTLEYNDGTQQVVKVMGINLIDHQVQFNLVSSEPPVSYSAKSDTIRLQRVTASASAATFVAWTTHFSNDADAEVLSDSSFKKRDAFVRLKQALDEGQHSGEWRAIKYGSGKRWCKLKPCDFGTKMCEHKGGYQEVPGEDFDPKTSHWGRVIKKSHWSCCGATSRTSACVDQTITQATFRIKVNGSGKNNPRRTEGWMEHVGDLTLNRAEARGWHQTLKSSNMTIVKHVTTKLSMCTKTSINVCATATTNVTWKSAVAIFSIRFIKLSGQFLVGFVAANAAAPRYWTRIGDMDEAKMKGSDIGCAYGRGYAFFGGQGHGSQTATGAVHKGSHIKLPDGSNYGRDAKIVAARDTINWKGDTITCKLDFATGKVTFVHNDKSLGEAPFPTVENIEYRGAVSLDKMDDCVELTYT